MASSSSFTTLQLRQPLSLSILRQPLSLSICKCPSTSYNSFSSFPSFAFSSSSPNFPLFFFFKLPVTAIHPLNTTCFSSLNNHNSPTKTFDFRNIHEEFSKIGFVNNGKTCGKTDFAERYESSSRFSSCMPKMEEIFEKEPINNDGYVKGGLNSVGLSPKYANSATSILNGHGHRHYIKDNNVNNEIKLRRKNENLSKKNKAESPAFRLRVGLDMCSKKGDVMGAISMYDSAVEQGVNMGQYHYTVLLYLCSSAALGVIQPAKSGSGSRSLDMVTSQTMDKPSEYEEVKEDEEDDDDANDQTRMPESGEIRVSEDVKKYALEKGLEIYERMCLGKVQMNEAALTSVARMAMAMGDGDMALDMVNQMKLMGINPKLRSYGPALSAFSNSGEVEKAFAVEKHMLENGAQPEEPELEALLRVSIETGKADRVYYLLHKLRTNVRSVSPTTADLIEKWFKTKVASRIGKRKWDPKLIAKTMENVGGGWHGQGWLGKGKWTVSRTSLGVDGLCKCCGEKLALIDLDPEETERFAESVASLSIKREKKSSFQKFQRWLDYYGPFEAVVDAANVGLLGQRKFKPSKVNAVVNGIRLMLPSRRWPLIVLHNRRLTDSNMDKPVNRALADRWRNADALYATPTGSNDDWYWLYAAIKFKSLIVTNDEMRDHTFQLLGTDFFPKWKERHQVRFSFTEIGPVFHMPPPCSVVIQESERGNWHVPLASEHQSEGDRTWLCISRPNPFVKIIDPPNSEKDSEEEIKDEKEYRSSKLKSRSLVEARMTSHKKTKSDELISKRQRDLRDTHSKSISNLVHLPIWEAIEAAEKLGGCVIDFQI